MEGQENQAYDVEAASHISKDTQESNAQDVKLKQPNGYELSNGTSYPENMQQENNEKNIKMAQWRIFLEKIKLILTFRRVLNTLIILYFIGALLYWFVFNPNELHWVICENQGLVFILIFFYLCYVLYFFSDYIAKIIYVFIPVRKFVVGLFGPLVTKILVYGIQICGLSAYLIWDIWDDFARWRSMIGVCKNIFILWICCPRKRAIKWEIPIRAMLFQFYLCLVLLRIPFVNDFVGCITGKFTAFLDFSKGGGGMVFGNLNIDIFAFMIMPVIMFLSFVVAVLNHLNILPSFISALGRALLTILGTKSEVEAFNSAASIFLGQTESPILIKDYLPKLTRSEMFTIMVGGLSTIAGAVMAAYIQFGLSAVHMITASILSAIGTIGACKIFLPDTEPSETRNMVHQVPEKKNDVNIFDLTTSSAKTALDIFVSIITCLIIWLSVIPFVDSVIENGLYLLCGVTGVTFQYLLGMIFTPFAYLMGADWNDSTKVGELIGIKILINEFVAYTELKALEGIISARSTMVATYALCGFSNFGAMATLVSTLKVMAPTRTRDITRNAYWSLLVANVVCDMTACIAGALSE